MIKKLLNNIRGISYGITFPAVIHMHPKKKDLLDIIVFPHIDLLDPMKSTLFNKAAIDMKERFTGRHAMVDICPIRDIINLAGITLFGESAEALTWLERLHCVKIADLHPEIARQLPYRINMVFSGGDYAYPWIDSDD